MNEAEIDTRQLQPVSTRTQTGGGEWHADFALAAFLALIVFILYATPALLGRPVCETPEARVAVVAREMLASGDYLVPTLGGEARLNKPPLPYWLAALTTRVLDPRAGPEHAPTQAVLARAVELPSALASALAVFVVVLYAALVFSRAAGIFAGLALGCSVLAANFALRGYGDTELMFTTTLALCGAAWLVTRERPGFFSALLMGVGLGLAVLVKGHVPVLVVALPLIAEVLLRRAFNGRKVLLATAGLAIAAAIAAPWYLLVEKAHPGAWHTMRGEVGDGLIAAGHYPTQRAIFYWHRLAGGLLPWTPLLLLGGCFYLLYGRKADAAAAAEAENSTGNAPIENRGWLPSKLAMERSNLRFMALAGGLGFMLFYAAPKQQDYYLLPILPPLLLACGAVIARLKHSGGQAEEGLAWAQLWLGILLAAAVASFPAWLPQFIHGDGDGDIRQALGFLSAPSGWVACISAAGVLLLLSFALARQWVEGRVIAATLIFGAAAWAGLFAWSVHWARRVNIDTSLKAEAPGLREELRAFPPGTRVYGMGTSKPKLVFWLERPINDLHDIPQETDGSPASRVLVISRSDLARNGAQLGLKASATPETQEFMLLPLSADRDWAAVIQRVFHNKFDHDRE